MAAAGAGARISTGIGVAVLCLTPRWYMGGGLPSLEKGLAKALMGTGRRWGAGGCCCSAGLPLPEPRTRLWIWKRMSMCLFAAALLPPPSHSSLTWQQERGAHDASHPASSFPWQARPGLGLSPALWGSRELPPPPACVGQHDCHLSTVSLPASPTNLFAHDCWQSKKGAYQKQLFFTAFSERLLICLLRAASHVPSAGGYGTSLA